MADEQADALNDAIAEQALEPQSVTADGMTVTQRPIGDVIAARDAIVNNDAAPQPHRGLRFTKIIPTGK